MAYPSEFFATELAALRASGAPADVMAAAETLAAEALDPLRRHLGRPLRVTSWWRPGTAGHHPTGWAIDVVCAGLPGGGQSLLREYLAAWRIGLVDADWDQLEIEHPDDQHLHIDLHPRRRGQVLLKVGSGYVDLTSAMVGT